ncbi:MAG: hypothetical protein GY904_32650, partial [Planctomycetaceae bacterium]|nr:hypothetical protein [Planctomycetaceae bacterium]
MKLLTTLLLSAVLQVGVTSEDSWGGQPANAADQIDAIIRRDLEKRDLQPNPLVGDLQFVRRVYLDVIGR